MVSKELTVSITSESRELSGTEVFCDVSWSREENTLLIRGHNVRRHLPIKGANHIGEKGRHKLAFLHTSESNLGLVYCCRAAALQPD